MSSNQLAQYVIYNGEQVAMRKTCDCLQLRRDRNTTSFHYISFFQLSYYEDVWYLHVVFSWENFKLPNLIWASLVRKSLNSVSHTRPFSVARTGLRPQEIIVPWCSFLSTHQVSIPYLQKCLMKSYILL